MRLRRLHGLQQGLGHAPHWSTISSSAAAQPTRIAQALRGDFSASRYLSTISFEILVNDKRGSPRDGLH